jgi:tetratricopeptide (TPR) repeat protein
MSKNISVSAQVSAGEQAHLDKIDAQFRAAYYYSLAELAAHEGHAAEAAALLERASEADPQSNFLLREQGSAWEAVGKDALAVECLQKALDQTPMDLELRQQVARIHLRAGRKELAQSLFLNADGTDPEDPAYLRALIGIDVSTDALPLAEARLRRLLAGKGAGPDERELLALTLQRQERWDEAVKEFKLLVAADRTRSSAWARLAACEDARGDSLGAMEALNEGLLAVPDSVLLQDQVAKAHYRMGHFKEAEAAFGRLVLADPKDAQSLLYRGLSRLKQKRYAEAQDDFSQLGQLEVDSPSQLYGLGLSLLWQGKDAEAEKALLKVLELNPQAVPAYTQLAFLYDKQGRTDKAVELLKRGHRSAPRSYDLAMLLSAAYMDQKAYAAAEAVYLDALAQGEGKTQIRFQLAVLYDKWDKFPKAEETLKALLEEEPKNAQALNYLGYSWVERGGNLKAAEGLIRRALEQDPGNAFYEDSLGWALYKEGDAKAAAEILQGAGDKVLKSAETGHPDAEEAVVLDHLAAVREKLGQATEAQRAKAAADSLRKKALDRAKDPADPSKEPDL